MRRTTPSAAFRAVDRHVRNYFAGHPVDLLHFDDGPIRKRVPDFHAVRVEPGPRIGLWTYVSVGLWDATERREHGVEFILTAPADDPSHVEHLAMAAYYHAGPEEQRLDVGHTVPIGEPWIEGSSCDHFVVSLPYPFGQDLEICTWNGGHARLLWLLPITQAERDFKAANGLDALESLFDEQAINFWEPTRRSVV